jgi:hypothetical protein
LEPWLLAPIALAITVALAIVRHRLDDIDRVINRTLVYGLLTALLGAVYVAGVFLLGRLLDPADGQSELAVAASTLTVAALFQPARRRVQTAVDRRFNRARYDAARTVASFSTRLRDEIAPVSIEPRKRCLTGIADDPYPQAVPVRPSTSHVQPCLAPDRRQGVVDGAPTCTTGIGG